MLKKLFIISIVSLVLGQLTTLTNKLTQNVYLFDIIVTIFAFTGLIYFIGIKKRIYIPKYLYLFLIFTIFAGLSLLYSSFTLEITTLTIGFFYLVRWVIYLTSGIVIYNMFKFKLISKKEFLNIIIYSGVFVAIAGFIQLLILPDFSKLNQALGWDPHKNRLASTFFDPNYAGAYLSICFALAFNKKKRDYSTISILLAGIFYTFSRSSWVFLAIIVVIYSYLKYPWLFVAFFIIVFSAYYTVPRVQTRITGTTDSTDSARFRLISWKNSLDIWQEHKFLGVGYNTYRDAQKNMGFFKPGEYGGNSGGGSDSGFLLVLATTGIFGFIIFLLAYFYPLFHEFKTKYNIEFISVFVGLFFESQFVNSLFYPQILFIWIGLLACFSYFSFDT